MPEASSTFQLIERFHGGDPDAFALLFEKYRPRLAVLIHYKLGPDLRRHVELDDLLQEVFLVAVRELDNFTYRSPGSFMAWLGRIADHVIVDTARYHGRQKRRSGETVPLRSESNPGGAEPANSVTPSRLLAQKEAVENVLRKLDSLPDDYRRVILMAKVEGLTTQEMADRLGKSREAVALLLHRALKRLRGLEPS